MPSGDENGNDSENENEHENENENDNENDSDVIEDEKKDDFETAEEEEEKDKEDDDEQEENQQECDGEGDNEVEEGDKEMSGEESDSESSSSDSDSLDEEETEQKRVKYLGDMAVLEKQFSDLKEQMYREKLTQVERKLEEVQANVAQEYIQPLQEIEDMCKIRGEVAGRLKEYRMGNLQNRYEAELQAAGQHFENEKYSLMENMRLELEDKLRKVEEDRHTVEMYSDLWFDDPSAGKKRKKGMEMFIPDKRKKPITVSGPYIIYMLREMDILEDWASIRKAKSELARRKTEEEKHPLYQAKYEDGKFFYEGQWFQKGDKVVLDNRVDSPVKATITSLNTGEVWVSKRDGIKCKLYIAQFQRGKYLMRRQTGHSVT